MKLLLGSNGAFLTDTGFPLLDMEPADFRIGYVLTASKSVDDLSYLERHKEAMAAAGYTNVEPIDIEGKTADELREIFADKNVIHVEGGNTFYLLKAIRESGFEEVVREALDRGVVYAGTSAGAYVACPTIEMARFGLHKHDEHGVTDLTGMGLVPFLVKAHYKDEQAEMMREMIKNSSYPVRLLRDGQGIFVNGDEVQFVGVGDEPIL
ncbi:MAG: hypothetical protein COU11_00465 [Candidatus Harrisonbacteria bacterium CG10_big_fil_rev_8_21_14_0_10_49_15]|uniref:Peptidase n=1 Tax=Candidatus Harrisonbacteria bacterium CG10_big_fil_rev_8_21_14_0_10_49_15 TaxID=1974587 RepID=A0A2H0UM38_9BACT|nr:MAG: hypothetical protein COU11_00465 [Candidatus Harrisonbacteria bacterium CG10_big_fil_rev_8_21_14_0_10_49_15]